MWLLVLLSCAGTAHPEPAPAAPNSVAPAPSPRAPTPLRVQLQNDTDQTWVLDRSFGPAAPFGLARLDGPLRRGARLDDVDDPQSRSWLSQCVCDCAVGATCRQCEPPADLRVELAPGERYDFSTSGLLRAWKGGCAERFSPPSGHYVISACDTSQRCAQAEVRLPSAGPVLLRTSQGQSVHDCSRLSRGLAGRLAGELLAKVTPALHDRDLTSCPREPRCVAPELLSASLDGARGDACSIWVIPRGATIEVLLFSPLTAGTLGGERFSWVYDAAGSQPLGSRYEQ